MTNDEQRGYRIGPEARVVVHRHASRGTYAVAVVLDEGPFTPEAAAQMAEEARERFAGVVSKATAAARLGVTERSVDLLRASGVLRSSSDETRHVLIDVASLDAELERRRSA